MSNGDSAASHSVLMHWRQSLLGNCQPTFGPNGQKVTLIAVQFVLLQNEIMHLHRTATSQICYHQLHQNALVAGALGSL